MRKFSVNDWLLKLFIIKNKEIFFIAKLIILLLVLGYIGYFVRFGFEFGNLGIHTPLKTLLKGLLIAGLTILIFFIMHFSGRLDFDIRLIGLPIGLAISGVVVGLIAGLIQGPIGWIMGGLIGIVIITILLRLYSKEIAEFFKGKTHP